MVALASCAAAAGGQGAKIYKESTEHYDVETTIGSHFAEVVGRHMEAIYREYSRRFEEYGEADRKFNVAVFRNEEQYAAHVPAEVRGSTGVFVSRTRLLAAHADGRTGEEVLRTLYHEGFHQFMYELISQRCPIWLNEGLAEYFSEATWNGRDFGVGHVPGSRLYVVQQAVKQGKYVPFAELFSMSSESWLQNIRTDNHRANLVYCQSWSIVHFLLQAENGRYVARMGKLVELISEGNDQEEAFKESFGPGFSLRAFERAWAEYIMSLKPSPKFECRNNMRYIMMLAKSVYGDPTDLRDLEDLRGKVMSDRISWRIENPYGDVVSSDDRGRVARLFRCPFDEDGHNVSYVIVKSPGSGLPVLVCTHHPGIIIKAYYRPDGEGGLAVEVEEEVRDLLSPAFKRAITAGMR